jgi:hypothetical protein
MENKVRQLHVTIYRYPNADCSNHGLSSKHDMLHCFDGDVEDVKHYVEENGYDIHECLYVVRRMLWGEPHPYLTPLDWAIKNPNGNVCFGGNYAVGDSRWNDWFGHNLPLPIHDRYDSWEDYEVLTR